MPGKPERSKKKRGDSPGNDGSTNGSRKAAHGHFTRSSGSTIQPQSPETPSKRATSSKSSRQPNVHRREHHDRSTQSTRAAAILTTLASTPRTTTAKDREDLQGQSSKAPEGQPARTTGRRKPFDSTQYHATLQHPHGPHIPVEQSPQNRCQTMGVWPPPPGSSQDSACSSLEDVESFVACTSFGSNATHLVPYYDHFQQCTGHPPNEILLLQEAGHGISHGTTSHGSTESASSNSERDSDAYSVSLHKCLKQAPNHELTLQKIYAWHKKHTSRDNEAKAAEDAGDDETATMKRKGWQCSIRHNLSMNDAFEIVQKGLWRLSDDYLDGIAPTTSFRKERSHHSSASPARGLDEVTRHKRSTAGQRGGKAARNFAQTRSNEADRRDELKFRKIQAAREPSYASSYTTEDLPGGSSYNDSQSTLSNNTHTGPSKSSTMTSPGYSYTPTRGSQYVHVARQPMYPHDNIRSHHSSYHNSSFHAGAPTSDDSRAYTHYHYSHTAPMNGGYYTPTATPRSHVHPASQRQLNRFNARAREPQYDDFILTPRSATRSATRSSAPSPSLSPSPAPMVSRPINMEIDPALLQDNGSSYYHSSGSTTYNTSRANGHARAMQAAYAELQAYGGRHAYVDALGTGSFIIDGEGEEEDMPNGVADRLVFNPGHPSFMD